MSEAKPLVVQLLALIRVSTEQGLSSRIFVNPISSLRKSVVELVNHLPLVQRQRSFARFSLEQTAVARHVKLIPQLERPAFNRCVPEQRLLSQSCCYPNV